MKLRTAHNRKKARRLRLRSRFARRGYLVRIVVTIYPGGFRVKNHYNALGFLKEVRTDGGTVASGIYKDVLHNQLFWQADSHTVAGATSRPCLGPKTTNSLESESGRRLHWIDGRGKISSPELRV